MSSRQRHRGPHPSDERLFGAKQVPALRRAVTDLSYLYTRGYSEDAAVTLVGDKYQLSVRQRRAVRSGACSDDARAYREAHAIAASALRDYPLCIDGYNLLIAAESALSGAYLFRGRDGYLRDLASLHGSYRRVDETQPALEWIGETLVRLEAPSVQWYFDAPVSNSGRLRALLTDLAEARGWHWQVELSTNVDAAVAAWSGAAITSDSWILDRAPWNFRLLDVLLERGRVTCPVVNLVETGED